MRMRLFFSLVCAFRRPVSSSQQRCFATCHRQPVTRSEAAFRQARPLERACSTGNRLRLHGSPVPVSWGISRGQPGGGGALLKSFWKCHPRGHSVVMRGEEHQPDELVVSSVRSVKHPVSSSFHGLSMLPERTSETCHFWHKCQFEINIILREQNMNISPTACADIVSGTCLTSSCQLCQPYPYICPKVGLVRVVFVHVGSCLKRLAHPLPLSCTKLCVILVLFMPCLKKLSR